MRSVYTVIRRRHGTSCKSLLGEITNDPMIKKKTFCTGRSQKVLIRGLCMAPLVGRTTRYRAIVLTATPDHEVIYSPFSSYGSNIRHRGKSCQGTGVWQVETMRRVDTSWSLSQLLSVRFQDTTGASWPAPEGFPHYLPVPQAHQAS
jgi:hypothetical protein